MGVATGCGCKEVYRFPHTTYPYSSCICSFLQQHPYFLFIKKKKFFCNYKCMYIIMYQWSIQENVIGGAKWNCALALLRI